MSRMSQFAMEFVPISAAPGANARLIEYLKMGNNLHRQNPDAFAPSCSERRFGSSPFELGALNRQEHNYSLFANPRNSSPALLNESQVKLGSIANYPYSPSRLIISASTEENASMSTPIINNSLGVNVGRSSTCQMAPDSKSKSQAFQFWPSTIQSDLQAIWEDNQSGISKCMSRFRNMSLSSEATWASNLSLESTTFSSKSTELEDAMKLRTITGRASAYYLRFGGICIIIPQNVAVNYPARKVESVQAAAKNGALIGKTNQRKKQYKNGIMECVFCKNINSSDAQSHWLKNSQNVITCPKLLAYTCPLCKNRGGAKAHTIRYCPLKRQKLADDFERTKEEQTLQRCSSSKKQLFH